MGSDSAFAGSASAASAGGEAAAMAMVAAAAARETPLAKWAADGGGFCGSLRGGGGEGASAATSRRDAMAGQDSLLGVHRTRKSLKILDGYNCQLDTYENTARS